MKNQILSFVNKPEPNILSSQTLYECLFYNINMYSTVECQSYLNNAKKVAHKICETQLEDGGFDLGYDFIFGKGLHKNNLKEGTSPELLSLTALALYSSLVDNKDEMVLRSVMKAIDWIEHRVIEVQQGVYAIPYAPDSYKKVHIINATSFAISAIATSIQFIDDRERKLKFERYLDGMYKFMFSQVDYTSEDAGLWPYFYQNGSEEELKFINDKIDNYHMAQQLYHHMIADAFYPNEYNKKSIRLIFNYLVSIIDNDGFLPYTYSKGKATDKVDVWGFSSLIGCFSLYYEIYKCEVSRGVAEKSLDYLMKYAWNEGYFNPIILNSNKSVFDGHFYPRSDAWVIHAISDYYRFVNNDECVLLRSQAVFSKILNAGFTGLENHTITPRKRLFAALVNLIKKVM
ncbi:hypothetical protein EDB67_12234 [Vibrio crassostreae]|uniref:hypothetical protein n=1 Tax=Vibrio crassostreae TaxID=246167 RepID=UPI000F49F049|nr:hypothetical protein [Vibrio crassostreae]ROR17237.1 hypothetical protein EDB67_12234 [Vibrio crassostreae]